MTMDTDLALAADDAAEDARYAAELANQRARIDRGTALLDVRVPGWRGAVDPSVLDLADCHRCVVGQVLGVPESREWTSDWEDALARLGLDPDQTSEYGFDTADYESYDELTAAWVEELTPS